MNEIGAFMRAYENTVVDIEGNSDSTGSRELNVALSKQRAETVKSYLMTKYGYPGARCVRFATDRTNRSTRTIPRKVETRIAVRTSRCIRTRQRRNAWSTSIRKPITRQWQLILAPAWAFVVAVWFIVTRSELLPPLVLPEPVGVVRRGRPPVGGL